MKILGIDQSLSHVGLALVTKDKYVTTTFKTNPKEEHEVRLILIVGAITTIWKKHKPELTVLENYAYGKAFQMAVMGEVLGCIRFHLKKLEAPFTVVAPTTAKKTFTGSGRASKEQMIEKAREYCDVKNEHEADALALAIHGYRNYRFIVQEALPD